MMMTRRALAILALLTTCSLPAYAQTDAPVSEAAAEMSFIDAFIAKAMPDTPASPEVPAVPDVPPAKKTESPTDAEPAPADPDGDTGTPPPEPPAADAKPTDPDQPEKTPEPGTDDTETDEEQDKLDAEFEKAAAAQKIPTTLDDLPAEARPLVEKRLKAMEAGFTRAMQDARAYRADELAFRAEERFRAEHTADFIVQMLRAKPELGSAVNALLDSLDTETNQKAHDIVVKDQRREATEATQKELRTREQRVERGLALDAYARTAAQRAGVPFELGVPEAVVAHLEANGDVTESDIDRIVQEKAKVYARHIRANRRAATEEYTKTKAAAAKAPSVKVKPGSGNAPAPAAKRVPKTEDEFVNDFSERM